VSQKFLEKLSSTKEIDAKRDLNLDNFNKLNKYCYKDEVYLPPIKEKKLYHYDKSKDIVLKNLNKKYFEGNTSQMSLISFKLNNKNKNRKFFNSSRSSNISTKNKKNKSVNLKKLDCYEYNKAIEFFRGFL